MPRELPHSHKVDGFGPVPTNLVERFNVDKFVLQSKLRRKEVSKLMKLRAGTEIRARALLFDMDGTLVDSTAAVERAWKRAAAKWDADFEKLRRHMHGRRAIDIMRDILSPEASAQLEAEVAAIDKVELTETDGIMAVAGASELLAALPPDAWALVTSARPALAAARMRAADLPLPATIITSATVARGKPHPECFLRAAERLGVAPKEALVLEDAPAGLVAGRAAGCQVVALATTMESECLADVDWIPDLSVLRLEVCDADGWMTFRIAS
ncbi:MAG: HAD-IA family hydrolase [Roseiarcus sp.]